MVGVKDRYSTTKHLTRFRENRTITKSINTSTRNDIWAEIPVTDIAKQIMDFKDFIKLIKFRDAEAKKQSQVTYAMKQRQSRPRIKKNILGNQA